MKPKVTVGQKLFSLNIGNAARHRKQVLTPVVVTKVGLKYFTVAEDDKWRLESQYHIDTWREKTEYTEHSKLYESEQSYKDEVERGSICLRLWKCFEYGRNQMNLSNETLRKIDALVNEDKR